MATLSLDIPYYESLAIRAARVKTGILELKAENCELVQEVSVIKIFESFTRRLQAVKAKGGMNNNRY